MKLTPCKQLRYKRLYIGRSSKEPNLQINILLLQPLCNLLQHDVSNLLHFQLGELSEYNNLVQPVQKLRTEVLLELLIDKALDSVVTGVFLTIIQLETNSTATFLDDTASNI